MNITSILVGALCVCFGLCTLVLRAKRPQSFGKLEAMKQAWGEVPGTAIHVVAYSVVPLIFGAFSILAGLRGASLF